MDELLDWFAQHQRDLPWRGPDRDPWLVLMSEIMLQQTQVDRVIPYFLEWSMRWPTPADLAACPTGDVVRAWGRLGYPRRALRLHAAATVIRDEHQNVVPDDYVSLVALPGIGDYTASAVLAFAFRRRIPVMDTNVRRAHARVLAGASGPTSSAPNHDERQRAVSALPTDPESAATLSEAWMELGATVCRAITPTCTQCPVQATCRWDQAGRPGHADGGTRHKQARFQGSDRQVRGIIMSRLRNDVTPLTAAALDLLWSDRQQLHRAADSLVRDGLASRSDEFLRLC